MITYRRALFDDVEEIHRLCNHFAEKKLMLPRSRNAIYENLRDYVVALSDGRVVGCGALHFCWERLAEVRALAIDEAYARRGIGRSLVYELEKEGRALGVTLFFTLTYQDVFFEKCGYTLTSKDGLPQKVWKECVYCPLYPYCNEKAYIKKEPGFKPVVNKIV